MDLNQMDDSVQTMTRPENPYEAASYDLKKFRERRMAERRSQPRDTADRRMQQADNGAAREDITGQFPDNSAKPN
jgi:hypothetical protein